MEKDQELQVIVQENSHGTTKTDQHHHLENANNTTVTTQRSKRNYKWWILLSVYTLFLLAGQSTATLLGRLYFSNGGKSKWTFTFFQLAGFPLLIVYFFISPKKETNTTNSTAGAKPFSVVFCYVSIGLLFAGVSYLSSLGLLYLPVSTYSLICSSQLAFNAFFSYFLNKEKLTPFTFNSLFLLTVSSTLLVFNGDSQNPEGVSNGKYIIGFVCTVIASAAYGLGLSLTQFAFWSVIKKETFSAVVNMNFYQSLVAASAILVGLFASGEWKDITSEMRSYKLGKVSYVMTLVWSAVAWQVASVGGVGLIFEVSALFSNAVGALGLPIVPVLATIFFHEKMDGIKVVSLVLAIWGFISYAYQTYLDEKKMNANTDATEVPKDG